MTRQADVEHLAITVAELVDGYATIEIHDWRPTRRHPDFADRAKPLPKTAERRVHRTREPGLLEQLRRGPGRRRAVAKPDRVFEKDVDAEGQHVTRSVRQLVDAFALIADLAPTPGRGDSAGGHTKPTSRPPAQLHAAETLLDLGVAIADVRARTRAAAGMGRGPASSAPVMLRELLDLVFRQDGRGGWLVDDAQVRRLRRSARAWSSTARLALSYDAPVVTLRDKVCPECGGDLRVRQDASSDVWCAGIPGRFREGPSAAGEPWPIPDRGCGTTWPRLSWLDLLDTSEAG